ncbi:MAG: class I SAM-dependent methyltransferase [Candidatus Omnitrophica bacterium]|nr:class I SAM-dependent methyltransferase [Candidatus Omnitrophota bacterium]
MSLECIVCSSTQCTLLIKQGGYDIFRCRRCRLIFAHPLPDAGQLGAFYQNFGHNREEADCPDEQRLIVEGAMREKIRLAREIAVSPIKTFLDIGAGCGYYLHGAKKAGLDVTGVELDASAVMFAREHLGLEIKEGGFLEAALEDNYFDFVHLRNSIEHFTDPGECLLKINHIMKKGGVLILETPNSQSPEHLVRRLFLDAVKTLRRNMPGRAAWWYWKTALMRPWAYVDPPRHLYGFNKHNIDLLLATYGFKSYDIMAKPLGDPVYHPVSPGAQRQRDAEMRAAEARLFSSSRLRYCLYVFGWKPVAFILQKIIARAGMGNNLVVYAVKEKTVARKCAAPTEELITGRRQDMSTSETKSALIQCTA